MPNYNYPTDFATKFNAYVQQKRDEGSTESDNDLKARFAVSYVPHLRDKPLIYVTFTGSSTVKDDHKNNFSITKSSSKMHNLSCKTRVNKKDCKAGLLVAKEATEGTVLAILSGTHRHQRFSNDSYEPNGMLHEANTLLDCCEELLYMGITKAEVLTLFETGRLDQRYLPKAKDQFNFIKKAFDLYKEHVQDQIEAGNFRVYNKFYYSVTEDSSLHEKAAGLRYIGQSGQSAQDRNRINDDHKIGTRQVRFCGSKDIPTIDAFSGVEKSWSKWIETLTPACFKGCYRDEGYQLANKSLGDSFNFTVDEETDKMLAGYLFVYGLLKSENWRIETLTCVDYETLYKEAKAENEQKDVLLEQKDALIANLQEQIQKLSIEPKRKNPRQ